MNARCLLNMSVMDAALIKFNKFVSRCPDFGQFLRHLRKLYTNNEKEPICTQHFICSDVKVSTFTQDKPVSQNSDSAGLQVVGQTASIGISRELDQNRDSCDRKVILRLR